MFSEKGYRIEVVSNITFHLYSEGLGHSRSKETFQTYRFYTIPDDKKLRIINSRPTSKQISLWKPSIHTDIRSPSWLVTWSEIRRADTRIDQSIMINSCCWIFYAEHIDGTEGGLASRYCLWKMRMCAYRHRQWSSFLFMTMKCRTYP